MPPKKHPSPSQQGDGVSKPKRKAKPKSRSKKPSNHRKTLIILLSVLAVICIATVLFAYPLFFSNAPNEALIRIPANASLQDVRDSLAQRINPKFASRVITIAKIKGNDFSSRHGAYLVEAGMSPFRAERKLSYGAQKPLTLTINGFRTLPTLTERISRRFDFTADSLEKALGDPELIMPYGLFPEQALALFIDDSYELYWSSSPETVVKKIGNNYNKVWNKERRDKAAALGLTPAEVMTVCSIVDEESNKLDEKGKIGRLYINRLKIGMPLQADPTIRYALNDFTIRRVKGQHLKVDSPFNTYRNVGLPPSPIRTTSVATIDAVLNSAPSDHLYMCAKEDFSGYHNFASTYSEHLANARRYQKALDARGIK